MSMAQRLAIRQAAALQSARWFMSVKNAARMQYQESAELGHHMLAIHDVFDVATTSDPHLRYTRFRRELVVSCRDVMYMFGDELLPYHVIHQALHINPTGRDVFRFDFTIVLSTIDAEFIDA